MTLVRGLAVVIIGAGLAFRLSQYFSGRSMWLDESLLALNVLNRSVGGLSHPLDFAQGAPLGFLVAVKVLVVALGTSDSVVRLVPLLFGIGALPLMYIVARKVTTDFGALIALALFASADGLIYYSTEFKQYSCDVFAGLAISAVAITRRRPTWRRYAATSVIGATAIWFSHVTVFFVAAVFVAYLAYFLIDRNWSDLARVATSSLLVLVSLALFYAISYRDLGYLESSIGGSRPSGGVLRAMWSNVGEAMDLPLAAGVLPEIVRPVALAAALVGAMLLLRRRTHAALVLGLPIVFALGASALHRYPTFERTLLFLVPAVSLFLAHGIHSIARLARKPAITVLLGAALAALVLEHPVAEAARHLTHPRQKEEVKPLLIDLVERWRPGDALYVYYSAQYALRYYVECGCLGVSTSAPPLSFATRKAEGPKLFSPALLSRRPHFIIGVWREGNYSVYSRVARREIRSMFGLARVWVLFAHANTLRERHFEEVDMPRFLDRSGRRIAKLSRFHAELFLYDLRPRPKIRPPAR